MYIYNKITVWQRTDIDDNIDKDKVIEILETENVNSLWDLDSLNPTADVDFGTEQQISPRENNGEATIELYDDEGNLIWDNSIKK